MPNKFFRLIIITCSLWSCAVTAHLLPKQANIPGGVAIVNLELTSVTPPPAYYQGKRTAVIADPAREANWLSIVGIPLNAKPGVHNLQIHTGTDVITKNFIILPKIYPSQKLTIANKRKVQPLAEDLAIIEAQYLETIKTYDHWQTQDLPSVILDLPIKGRKSSPFGLTRIMNNIPQNPHSGLDLAAPKGTPVQVAQAGRVINIGNFFYSGKIIFVDHGQGFITSYCHLDSITVVKGQQLTRGAIIGTVGNTGRATGPHLHWSVSLNGVRVDPELFIYG